MRHTTEVTPLHEALDVFRERLMSPVVQEEMGARAYLLAMISHMLYIPAVQGGRIIENPHYESLNAIPLVGLGRGETVATSMVQPLPIQKVLARTWAMHSWNEQQLVYTEQDLAHIDRLSIMPSRLMDISVGDTLYGLAIRPMRTHHIDIGNGTTHVYTSVGRPHIGILRLHDAYRMADTIAHEVSHVVDFVLMPGSHPDPGAQEEARMTSELTAISTQSTINTIARSERVWWRRSIPFDPQVNIVESLREKHNGPYDNPQAFVLSPGLMNDLGRLSIRL